MDPTTNPFTPGAGTQPPELAGRGGIIAQAEVALRRVKAGRAAKSQMLLGLRGVGKTVLLIRIAEIAEAEGFQTITLEAPEDRKLVEMLVPPLRHVLCKLSRLEKAKSVATAALGALRSFAKAFNVKVGDLEFKVEPETGTADSGSLDADLPELLMAVAKAAKLAGGGVALFIDEVQYLSQTHLAALLVSVHKLAQRGLPFLLFGAGLPQLAALAGEAKSYAERLFDYPDVGPLADDAARAAIAAPVQREGVKIAEAALREILQRTQGYPYFLQEWGHHAWNVAQGAAITERDAQQATVQALGELDHGFFKVRLDRLTPREKSYLRAMAELGGGPHRSGVVARCLGLPVTTAAPLRGELIRKGMVYCPQHGHTAFTVPMFDEFMKRSMPDWTPIAPARARAGDRGKRGARGR
ncbi:MAG: ATP-binding protein [Planctomycetes bacterium]|nr:ATP-binding protein [Planctomycetota bacterium]